MPDYNYSIFKKTITELTVAGWAETSNDDDVLTEIRDFHENLYSPDMGSNFEKSFHDFTEKLSINLPKLTEDKRDALEGKLTLEDCRNALMCLRCGKSPGEEALPLNFTSSSFDW